MHNVWRIGFGVNHRKTLVRMLVCGIEIETRQEQQLKLTLRIQRMADAAIVRCAGQLVGRQETRMLTQIVAQRLQEANLAVLDLAEAVAMDSAGLSELALIHMYAEGHGKTVKLAAVPPALLEVLESTNLTSVFEVCASVDEALGETVAAP
jgi:anti-anti-sigma factor